MVEVFKSYALEQAKIWKAYEDSCSCMKTKIDDLDAVAKKLSAPEVTLKDATNEGYQALMKKLQEATAAKEVLLARKKAQEQELDHFKANHSWLMGKFYEAAEPLRKAVAKEWESMVELGLSRNLVGAWQTHSGCYRTVKILNPTKIEHIRFRYNDGAGTVNYNYTAFCNDTGAYPFIPFMADVSLDLQKAVIRAMTPPDCAVTFS